MFSLRVFLIGPLQNPLHFLQGSCFVGSISQLDIAAFYFLIFLIVILCNDLQTGRMCLAETDPETITRHRPSWEPLLRSSMLLQEFLPCSSTLPQQPLPYSILHMQFLLPSPQSPRESLLLRRSQMLSDS